MCRLTQLWPAYRYWVAVSQIRSHVQHSQLASYSVIGVWYKRVLRCSAVALAAYFELFRQTQVVAEKFVDLCMVRVLLTRNLCTIPFRHSLEDMVLHNFLRRDYAYIAVAASAIAIAAFIRRIHNLHHKRIVSSTVGLLVALLFCGWEVLHSIISIGIGAILIDLLKSR